VREPQLCTGNPRSQQFLYFNKTDNLVSGQNLGAKTSWRWQNTQ